MATQRLTLTEVAGPYVAESVTLQSQMTIIAGTAPLATPDTNLVSLNSGDVILTCENTDASAQTVTITSVADAFNRVADITAFSMAAGETAARRFTRIGWGDGAGDMVVTVSDAGVLLTALKV